MSEKAIPKRYDVTKRSKLRTLEFFLLMIAVFFLLFRFVLGVSWVDGISMQPTLKDGETIVYSRLDKDYSAGDIISIKMPNGDYYIKRIVAAEGDTVELKDGCLYVNGVKEQSQWAVGSTEEQDEDISYPLTLGRGQYFALGDNREGSIDSRTYGPVSAAQIRGTVIFHFKLF